MKENTLIVYYSQARGNTKRIAEKIQKAKGYDIAEIETVKPYTGSYEDIVDQGMHIICLKSNRSTLISASIHAL